ncbi:MAG: NAD-dependent epimerase/dehydratase family protein [Myxococcales bacterium]|nr:NAD-dependent epimerase/dehydratase family protein [Myxococcales bacterium]
MKILITGAGGFVGGHLIDHLAAQGDRVCGADFQPPNHPALEKSLALDVTDARAVAAVLAETVVDAVIHLAAVTFVPDAEDDPTRAIAVNVGGTANLLHALKAHRPQARLLLISTAEVYGAPEPERLPLTENSSVRPVNVYATTKWLAEEYARFARGRFGLDILVARPFTHVGPRQRPVFALSSFAQQIAAIAAGKQEPVIHVGNLQARRDILDVRDVVRAYRLALQTLPAGAVFNICRGEAREIGDLLAELIRLSGKDIEVRVDPHRLRQLDIPALRGSAEYLRQATGWRPEISWRKTLDDLRLYWTFDAETDKA